MFPARRMRRLRIHPKVRELVSETSLSPRSFVQGLFVDEGLRERKEISSLPGVYRLPVEEVAKEAGRIEDSGIPAVLLFGVPKSKDEAGSQAYSSSGVVQRTLRSVKEITDLAVMTDLCLCQYTDHGHCGVLKGDRVNNDETLKLYARIAASHAAAGADVIAPSGMMDGQVAAIRQGLDKEGFEEVPILSYAVKYASSLYAPFREAAESRPAFGDRKSHQMDISTARQALLEAEADLEEGADILMVKPALPYLDIIRLLRESYPAPVAAFQVSGEYSMIKAAAIRGWLDEEAVFREAFTSMKRAGADFIITYYAEDIARRLSTGGL
ncbi:MAG: porphobilinogen synthase [Thermoplasmata archaeon]